jgi:hypothetical protein
VHTSPFAFAQRAVLDVHYRSHPDARPDLAEVTLAAAEIVGHPLATRPDLVRRAATEVGLVKDDLGPDDVLYARWPRRRSCMRHARTVVMDNEAVQALADPAHHKHRRVLAAGIRSYF